MKRRLVPMMLILLSCTGTPQPAADTVQLTLHPVPLGGTRLRLTLTHAGDPQGKVVDRDIAALGRRSLTVGLELGSRPNGLRLLAQVHGAGDGAAVPTCPLAQGEGPLEGDALDVTLAAPPCANPLTLDRATPARAPADAETEVVLHGAGFTEDTKATVDGSPVTLTWRTANEVAIAVPKAADPTRVYRRKVPIELSRPGLPPLRRDDLLVYYERRLRLAPMGDPAYFPASTSSGTGLAHGDLDGDGRTDVVVPTSTRHFLLFNQGDRLRAPMPLELPAGTTAHRWVYLADVTGDRLLDLIYGATMGKIGPLSIVVRPGRPDTVSRFGSDVYSTMEIPISGFVDLVMTELTGEGGPDLAALVEERPSPDVKGTPFMYTRQEIGNSGAGPVVRCPLYGTRNTSWMAAADLDGDRRPELIGSYSGEKLLSIAYSNPRLDGACGPEVELPMPDGASQLATGDTDGDGATDLAVGTSAGVTILLGDGAGGFKPSRRTLPGLYPLPGLWLGDLNGDGRADLVTIRSSPLPARTPGELEVWLAQDGGFAGEPQAAYTLALPDTMDTQMPVGFGQAKLDATDMDGDGRPDLLISGTGVAAVGAGVWVLRNLPVPPQP